MSNQCTIVSGILSFEEIQASIAHPDIALTLVISFSFQAARA
jgi:hypothetical protein